MRIVRIHKKVNADRDKESPHTEVTKSSRRRRTDFLPQRAQLLTIISALRQSYSAKKLEHSKRLIQKSRRLIFETEVSLSGND
jgi:hypothetical protein